MTEVDPNVRFGLGRWRARGLGELLERTRSREGNQAIELLRNRRGFFGQACDESCYAPNGGLRGVIKSGCRDYHK